MAAASANTDKWESSQLFFVRRCDRSRAGAVQGPGGMLNKHKKDALRGQ